MAILRIGVGLAWLLSGCTLVVDAGVDPGGLRCSDAGRCFPGFSSVADVCVADGSLGGYAWGLERKQKLLEIEKRTRK